MPKTRVLIVLERDEVAKIKAYCKDEGYQFGAWARKVMLEAAGLRKPKEVNE